MTVDDSDDQARAFDDLPSLLAEITLGAIVVEVVFGGCEYKSSPSLRWVLVLQESVEIKRNGRKVDG
jgi:hypothetical protein